MADYALVLKQPWAMLVMKGIKQVDVRLWETSHRGRLFIYASNEVDEQAMKIWYLPAVDKIYHDAFLGYVNLKWVEPFNRDNYDYLYSYHLDKRKYSTDLVGWYYKNPVMFEAPVFCNNRLITEIQAVDSNHSELIEIPSYWERFYNYYIQMAKQKDKIFK